MGSNLPPKDNLRKEDKSSDPKVSFIWRFHCTLKQCTTHLKVNNISKDGLLNPMLVVDL